MSKYLCVQDNHLQASYKCSPRIMAALFGENTWIKQHLLRQVIIREIFW